MFLNPGTTLGSYTVTAKIGEGGMGEVYRARDTKLDRDVALKVLPQAFTDDPDRLARFEREAKVLASLNHPNIGGIHGLEESEGIKALVLEYIEGPTLADRIKQGPIPVDEALPIAKQIAEALEAAHEQGIIHRDLKPANIKLKPDGTVKVLDFGLAKAFQPDASDASASMSPTISLTAAATQMGMIVGTAAYMAPEQASGKAVDKRTDVWAFGVILHEMLTGQRLFSGEDISHTLAHVLTKEIDWNSLSRGTPDALRRLLRRCLERDPKKRMRDIGDARIELDDPQADPHTAPLDADAAPQVKTWQQPAPLALAAMALMAITGLAVWTLKPSSPIPVSRLAVSVPPSAPVSVNGQFGEVAISEDGTTVVYQGADGLQVRAIDQLEGTPLRGGAAAVNPFLSPDGAWVGFATGNTLQKVSIQGGPAVTICRIPEGALRGASWGADDVIVFGTSTNTGLFRVAAAGGEPEALTETESGTSHRWPDVLPDGKGVLFSAGVAGQWQVGVLDLDTGEHEVIIPAGTHPRYSPTGHIVYGLEGTLRAVAFDVDSLRVTSDPVPVVEGVLTKAAGSAGFALSDTGSLAYVSGAAGAGGPAKSFVWVDREGREEPLRLPARDYFYPRVSPDGARLAVGVADQGPPALWVYDVVSAAGLRLTQEGQILAPLWTPDGERVVFASTLEGTPDLYWVPADGSGEPERLTTSDVADVPTSVTPDGRVAVFARIDDPQREIWHVPLVEDERTPTPVLQGEFARGNADVSPDGQWLAYRSDQSGQMEIYLQPYPGLGPTVPVSIGGGDLVTWAHDGSELYYRVDNRMMAVGVNPNGTVTTPTALFEGNYFIQPGDVRNYHVAPDGRFLMLKTGNATDDEILTQVVLVQNWFQELTERVPVN